MGLADRFAQLEDARLLAAMFERAPVGIAIAGITGRYVRANPAFLRLLGYTEEELLERSIHDVTHPQDKGEDRRLFDDMVAGVRDQIEYEKRYLRKDGRVIWVRNTVAKVPDEEGETRYVVATVEDITVRRHAEDELQHEQQRSESALGDAARDLQALTRRLVEAEETERHRLAGELHDRVGQNLSALNINLDIALGSVAKDNVEVKMRLADSLALVEGTLQTIEGLMAELRPPLLDEYGLGAALGWYANAFSQRTGVKVVIDNPEELGASLRPEAAIALFRIAQEALNNVAKHARAKVVRMLIERQEREIVLAIADDGRGFDTRERLSQSKRWGMTTMQERAAAVGGRIAVESEAGRGTVIRAIVPEEQGDASMRKIGVP